MQAALDDADKAKTAAQQNLAAVLAQLASTKADAVRLQDLSAERQSASNALADIQTQLTQARADAATQQRVVSDARTELVRLQQGAEAARNARAEQERQSQELADRITRLRVQSDELEKQRSKLVAVVAEEGARLVETDQKLAQARADLARATVASGVSSGQAMPDAVPALLPGSAVPARTQSQQKAADR